MLDDLVQQEIMVQSAEIQWALAVVQNHFSFRSCLGINDLYREMFPDSHVASKFQLSKTKCSYLIKDGCPIC